MDDEDRVGGRRGSDEGDGSLQKEFFMAEAKEAVKPFTLEFKRVEWCTIYVSRLSGTPSSNERNTANFDEWCHQGIGQCIAETFIKGRVILAGFVNLSFVCPKLFPNRLTLF